MIISLLLSAYSSSIIENFFSCIWNDYEYQTLDGVYKSSIAELPHRSTHNTLSIVCA